MANRFWVPSGGTGTGTWDGVSTANWSATSGGASGASVPGSTDSVFFDANSFTGPGQFVSVSGTPAFLDMSFTGTTNSPSFFCNFGFSMSGSLTLIVAMTFSCTGPVTFNATSPKTITMNGQTFGGALTFASVGGTYTLQDALTTTSSITLTKGTLNTNGKAVSCTSFIGNNTGFARTLTLGASTITCSSNWTFNLTASLTFNANTSTIILTGNTKTFAGGGLAYNNVTLSGTPIIITGSNTFNVLTFSSGKTITPTAGTTQTFTSLVANGLSSGLIILQSTSPGSAYTLQRTSGAQTFDYCDITDCTATGGATFTAGNSVNSGGNTGITFTGYAHKVMGNVIAKVNGAIPQKVIRM